LGIFLLLSVEHSLFILDTNPLVDMCFAKIFSQADFFIFLTMPSAE
jgi:hypothetical protein